MNRKSISDQTKLFLPIPFKGSINKMAEQGRNSAAALPITLDLWLGNPLETWETQIHNSVLANVEKGFEQGSPTTQETAQTSGLWDILMWFFSQSHLLKLLLILWLVSGAGTWSSCILGECPNYQDSVIFTLSTPIWIRDLNLSLPQSTWCPSHWAIVGLTCWPEIPSIIWDTFPT